MPTVRQLKNLFSRLKKKFGSFSDVQIMQCTCKSIACRIFIAMAFMQIFVYTIREKNVTVMQS